MRHPSLALLLLLLACLGCGGGGGGGEEEPEEVLLATWPYFEAGSGSERLESLVLGFAAVRENGTREEEIVLADVGDGQIGLQARVEAPEGGGGFLALVDRLTDGLDSRLATTITLGAGRGARSALESEALTVPGGAAPDLEGSIITAFQLDLTLVRLVDGIEDPLMKPGDAATAITEGSTYEVRGTIRILGFPGSTE